jgi:hypothetical protein
MIQNSKKSEINNIFFNSERIILNVGGLKHDIRLKTLESYPNSRLGRIRFAKTFAEAESLCDSVNLEKNEIYFDRSFKQFEYIIDFYRTNKLHLENDVCIFRLRNELEYWGLSDILFDQCCYTNYQQKIESKLNVIEEIQEFEKEVEVIDKFSNVKCCTNKRKYVWNTMEDPTFSKLAKVFILLAII